MGLLLLLLNKELSCRLLLLLFYFSTSYLAATGLTLFRVGVILFFFYKKSVLLRISLNFHCTLSFQNRFFSLPLILPFLPGSFVVLKNFQRFNKVFPKIFIIRVLMIFNDVAITLDVLFLKIVGLINSQV